MLSAPSATVRVKWRMVGRTVDASSSIRDLWNGLAIRFTVEIYNLQTSVATTVSVDVIAVGY
jgi:hypothetical protein